MINITAGVHLPGKDMAVRFGANAHAGIGHTIKFKKGFIFAYDVNYLFGQTVKEPQLLQNVLTTPDSVGNKYAISKIGALTNPRVWERGIQSHVSIGKLLFKAGPNENSGFFFTVGAGMLWHKIRIEDIGNNAPQLSKENIKGYDRLTSGFSTKEFIGYMYLHNKRRLSMMAGFEFVQGFTKSMRGYNYDTQTYDTQQRLDLLNGFKVGVIIPLYKKIPNSFYYY